MPALIPGLDVSEQPLDSAVRRLFTQDPGPGNPRVPAGGMSAEGQRVAQGLRSPMPTSAGALSSLGAVGQGLRTVSKALPVAGLVLQAAGSSPQEDLAMGDAIARSQNKVQGLRSAYGADTVTSAYNSTTDWRPFGTESNMRPEDLQSRISQYTSENAGGGRGFINPPAPLAAAPIGLRGDPNVPSAPPAMPQGMGLRDLSPTIQRTGNSFSDGSTGLSRVSTVPGFDREQAARISASNQDVINAGEGLRIAQGGMAPGITGFGGDDRVAKSEEFGRQADLRNRMMATRDPRMAAVLADQMGSSDRLRSETLRDHGETTRAAARNAAGLREAGLRANVDMRGQDFASSDHRYTADQGLRGHMAQMQREQFNADRSFGAQQANSAFDQRERGQKGFDDRVAGLFTTEDDKGNIVPDKATASAFTAHATKSLGDMITQLNQTGNPADAAQAAELAKKGLGGSDAKDLAYMQTLFARKQRMDADRGVLPGSGSGPVSGNLLDYRIVGKEGGLLQDRFKTAGGQSVGVNGLRYTTPANKFFPDWFKTPTADLGPTLDERKGMR